MPSSKAASAARAQAKGTKSQGKRKIRTSVTFRKPKTLQLKRSTTGKNAFSIKGHPRKTVLDAYSIIRHPLTTESAMKKIEDNNTLVFIVDKRANKVQIKQAVKKLYEIEVAKVNTLIRPTGDKKAFVRLHEDHDALDVANKIGVI
jgi:large subunit ribosomal protein L23Ae